MHNLSGHSLQFIVISIIKTSVLLSRVLGKTWHLYSIGLQGAPLHAVFGPVFQRHALKGHRPIDKKSTIFFSCTWFHKFCAFTVQWWVMDSEWSLKLCVRKFCMCHIFNKQFWLNFSRVKQCQTGTYFFGWVYLEKMQSSVSAFNLRGFVSYEARNFVCSLWVRNCIKIQ